MLIRITNQCGMGCNHCMVDAQPVGEFMEIDVFRQAMELATRLARPIPMLLLSGGEPTEHPEWRRMVHEAAARGFHIIVLSNGTFGCDPDRGREALDSLPDHVRVFVTNDPRYYPKRVPVLLHPKAFYSDQMDGNIAPFGRAIANHKCNRRSPMCFNVRSLVRQCGDLSVALGVLQARTAMCSPSVNLDGSVVAGETPFCYPIGTVASSPSALGQSLAEMRCGSCGLVGNLTVAERSAIGE